MFKLVSKGVEEKEEEEEEEERDVARKVLDVKMTKFNKDRKVCFPSDLIG